MERAINRDIEAQARDLANQRAGMSQQMSLLQWNYNKTGDIIAAAHSSKAAILRQKAADVIAEAAKFDQGGTQAEDAELLFREQLAKADAEERAALEAMRESKRKQRMEDELHASKLADAQAGRASKYAGIARGKEGSQREDRKLDEAQAEREAKQARLSRDPLYDAIHRAGGDPEKDRDKFAAVSFPNGRVEVIRTTEPAKTEAYFNAARDMVQGFDEILGMRDAAGRWTLSSEDLAKQMQSVYGMMTLDAKNFFDLGAITEADATLIERVIGGDPNAIRDFTALLDKSRSQLENKVRGRLENAQVKGAGEFGYPKLEPARGESKMPGDFRKEIRGGMKLGTLEDVTGSIDEAIRVMGEGGTGKNHDYFLSRIVKDAKAAGRDDVVDYARSLMK